MSLHGQIIVTFLVILTLNLKTSHSSKILIPGPLMRGQGHTTLLSALCAELTSRGHEVTILVPSDDNLKVGEKFSNSNASKILEYETVPIPESELAMALRAGNKSIGLLDSGRIFSEVVAEQVSYCRQLLSNDRVMSKLRQSNFDLMIVDMANGCEAVIPEVLQLPFVALTANTQYPIMNYLTYGFPMELSYVMSPSLIQPKHQPISFSMRVKNIFLRVVLPPLVKGVFVRPFTPLQKEFNISPEVDVLTLASKAQFWLAQDSFMFEDPHPGMPNWCHVGGMGAARPKPLPSEFAVFAEGSGDEGFIVFSTGSIVANFDANFTASVASILKRLPQRVFWKHKGVPGDLVGSNTKVSSWLPQNDLLAHPKARLFIGHGGLNGIYEALYHGVPMILIPQMMADQTLNAKKIENNGCGLHLDKKDFTAESLEIRINQILNNVNANFSETTHRCSQILQDDDPMDRAVYWVEHVLKFGGGYLRAEVFNLNFIQYYLLDVFALFLFIIVVCAMAVYFSCSFCCSFVGRRCAALKSNSVKNCKVD